MWFRQTIGNSCGLMALLHAAANGSAKDFIGVSPSELRRETNESATDKL